MLLIWMAPELSPDVSSSMFIGDDDGANFRLIWKLLPAFDCLLVLFPSSPHRFVKLHERLRVCLPGALMAPSGLPLALFVTVLWALVFVHVRSAFTGLFQSRLPARA